MRRRRTLKSRLYAAPYPLWAGVVCLAAAAIGALALDGYGVSPDEAQQRTLGQLTLDYLAGRSDELLDFVDRDYGVAFELPLILAERALGLEDSRSIYLLRHLLTHLFFIAGAFFASLLAWRMTGNRWLGLFALLLFLLHPRIYAHSFVNSKDLPFLSMFMVALYLVHRAFRRDTLGAFILCGIAVGLLSNLRIMGLMLFPAVIVMRGLDLGYEFRRPERRRHLLLTAGGFVVAAALTLYAAWPWLWGDPAARLLESLGRMANFPQEIGILLRGELGASSAPPGDYLSTWIAVTTPPAALLLGLAGTAAALYGGLARPGEIFRNTPRRFEWLLLACLILPAGAVIALDSSLYDGWRQMYFLYAPGGLLAVVGLHRLVEAAGNIPTFKLKILNGRRYLAGPTAVRGAIYAAAALGLAITAWQSFQLHPLQSLYFNFLTDRQTQERLIEQYTVNYWGAGMRQNLEYLLERYPDAALRVAAPGVGWPLNHLILPEQQRQRLAVKWAGAGPMDFYIHDSQAGLLAGRDAELFPPAIHDFRVYESAIYTLAALDLSLVDEATADIYRQRYQSAVAAEPVIRSDFEVYLQGRTLSWVKEECRPETWAWGVELALYPAEPQRLPPHRQKPGFIADHRHPLVRFDGRCFAQTTLPDYPLTRFRTSINRFDAATGAPTGTWVGHYYPGLPDTLDALNRLRAGRADAPADSARWEVYHDGQPGGARLLYAKAGCTAADREAWFFLHLTPANPGDLPGGRRGYGYANLDFQFEGRGLEVGRECIAIVPLPDYPIAAVATGQYADAGRLWEVTLSLK